MRKFKGTLWVLSACAGLGSVLSAITAHAGINPLRECGLQGSLEQRLADCSISVENRKDALKGSLKVWRLVSNIPKLSDGSNRPVQVWMDPDPQKVFNATSGTVNRFLIVARAHDGEVSATGTVRAFCQDIADRLPLKDLGIDGPSLVESAFRATMGAYPLERIFSATGVSSSVAFLEEGYDSSQIQKCPYGEAATQGDGCSWGWNSYDGVDGYFVCTTTDLTDSKFRWESFKLGILRLTGQAE